MMDNLTTASEFMRYQAARTVDRILAKVSRLTPEQHDVLTLLAQALTVATPDEWKQLVALQESAQQDFDQLAAFGAEVLRRHPDDDHV